MVIKPVYLQKCTKTKQAGFSLVELVIALALVSVFSLGATQFFTQVVKSNNQSKLIATRNQIQANIQYYITDLKGLKNSAIATSREAKRNRENTGNSCTAEKQFHYFTSCLPSAPDQAVKYLNEDLYFPGFLNQSTGKKDLTKKYCDSSLGKFTWNGDASYFPLVVASPGSADQSSYVAGSLQNCYPTSANDEVLPMRFDPNGKACWEQINKGLLIKDYVARCPLYAKTMFKPYCDSNDTTCADAPRALVVYEVGISQIDSSSGTITDMNVVKGEFVTVLTDIFNASNLNENPDSSDTSDAGKISVFSVKNRVLKDDGSLNESGPITTATVPSSAPKGAKAFVVDQYVIPQKLRNNSNEIYTGLTFQLNGISADFSSIEYVKLKYRKIPLTKENITLTFNDAIGAFNKTNVLATPSEFKYGVNFSMSGLETNPFFRKARTMGGMGGYGVSSDGLGLSQFFTIAHPFHVYKKNMQVMSNNYGGACDDTLTSNCYPSDAHEPGFYEIVVEQKISGDAAPAESSPIYVNVVPVPLVDLVSDGLGRDGSSYNSLPNIYRDCFPDATAFLGTVSVYESVPSITAAQVKAIVTSPLASTAAPYINEKPVDTSGSSGGYGGYGDPGGSGSMGGYGSGTANGASKPTPVFTGDVLMTKNTPVNSYLFDVKATSTIGKSDSESMGYKYTLRMGSFAVKIKNGISTYSTNQNIPVRAGNSIELWGALNISTCCDINNAKVSASLNPSANGTASGTTVIGRMISGLGSNPDTLNGNKSSCAYNPNDATYGCATSTKNFSIAGSAVENDAVTSTNTLQGISDTGNPSGNCWMQNVSANAGIFVTNVSRASFNSNHGIYITDNGYDLMGMNLRIGNNYSYQVNLPVTLSRTQGDFASHTFQILKNGSPFMGGMMGMMGGYITFSPGNDSQNIMITGFSLESTDEYTLKIPDGVTNVSLGQNPSMKVGIHKIDANCEMINNTLSNIDNYITGMNSPSSTFGFVDPTDFIDLNNSTDFRDIYVIGKAYDNSPKFQASWDPNNGTQSLVIFNEVPAGAVYNPWGQSVDSGYSMLFKSSPSALTSGGQTWNKMNGIKLTGFGDPNSMYSGGAVRVDAVFKCNRP